MEAGRGVEQRAEARRGVEDRPAEASRDQGRGYRHPHPPVPTPVPPVPTLYPTPVHTPDHPAGLLVPGTNTVY